MYYQCMEVSPMTSNYTGKGNGKTARIEKVSGSAWYRVEYTECNGLMVYSKSFPERKSAVEFSKKWVAYEG